MEKVSYIIVASFDLTNDNLRELYDIRSNRIEFEVNLTRILSKEEKKRVIELFQNALNEYFPEWNFKVEDIILEIDIRRNK